MYRRTAAEDELGEVPCSCHGNKISSSCAVHSRGQRSSPQQRGKVAETALSCDGTQLHSQYHTSVVCEAHVDMNVISVQTCIAVDINKLLYIVLFAMVL